MIQVDLTVRLCKVLRSVSGADLLEVQQLARKRLGLNPDRP